MTPSERKKEIARLEKSTTARAKVYKNLGKSDKNKTPPAKGQKLYPPAEMTKRGSIFATGQKAPYDPARSPVKRIRNPKHNPKRVM